MGLLKRFSDAVRDYVSGGAANGFTNRSIFNYAAGITSPAQRIVFLTGKRLQPGVLRDPEKQIPELEAAIRSLSEEVCAQWGEEGKAVILNAARCHHPVTRREIVECIDRLHKGESIRETDNVSGAPSSQDASPAGTQGMRAEPA